MEYAIAVFDVGKTNKKLLLFSDDLKPVHVESIRIGEVRRDDILCDDAERLEGWLRERLRDASRKYRIKGVNVSTYGATLAYMSRGSRIFPIISYNQDIEPEVRREFYERFGSPLELYKITGTPPYGRLIVAGLQIYWFRRRFPEIFGKVDRILFLPQYLLYWLSGLEAGEVTSIGCHTYLYDLRSMDWSVVARDLEVDKRSPDLVNVWDEVGTFDLDGSRVVAAPGIHDSNASILPFALEGRDALVASTGTWCVFMYPRAEFDPKPGDLDRDVVYYVNPYKKPVRSSRFAGGYEHDHYVKLIENRFGVDPRGMGLDPEILSEIISGRRDFVAPGLIEKTGQFQRSKPRIIGGGFEKSAKYAYHVLILSLAIQSRIAIDLISEGRRPEVIVLGGFANNEIYLQMLSALLQENRVFKSMFPETTGLGAAICCKCAIEGARPEDVRAKPPLMEVPKPEIDLDKLEKYVSAFVEVCSEGRAEEKDISAGSQ
ncbi:MAG: hypothetical protein DRN64_00920 [Thaumarchaeota archaeon]|nr:MAG: hypothetical protein DRN64_00920 [Nitrososphaerota archaeon]